MIRLSKQICIAICFVLAAVASPLMAQNNPYVDDKLLHFGFSLGVDMLSYSVEEADSLLQMQKYDAVYHARTSVPGIGFCVGFITDLRLARHLNLRFCPGMHFGERTITYKSYQDSVISGTNCTNNRPSVLCLPIDIPLYLKWLLMAIYRISLYQLAVLNIGYLILEMAVTLNLSPKTERCYFY